VCVCVDGWMDHFSLPLRTENTAASTRFSSTDRRQHEQIILIPVCRSVSQDSCRYPRVQSVYRIADAHWDAAGKRDSSPPLTLTCARMCVCVGLIDCRCSVWSVSEEHLMFRAGAEGLLEHPQSWGYFWCSLMLCVGSAHYLEI